MNLSPALTQNLALRSRRRRRLEGRPRFDTLAMLAPQREDLQSPQGPSLCPANASVAACPPDAVTELRAHGSFTLRQFIRPRTFARYRRQSGPLAKPPAAPVRRD